MHHTLWPRTYQEVTEKGFGVFRFIQFAGPHCARLFLRDRVVRRLLRVQHGADIGAQDKLEDYWTPLVHLASGKLEVTRLLLDHIADVDAKNKDGRT
jgi:hypothetical protein